MKFNEKIQERVNLSLVAKYYQMRLKKVLITRKNSPNVEFFHQILGSDDLQGGYPTFFIIASPIRLVRGAIWDSAPSQKSKGACARHMHV